MWTCTFVLVSLVGCVLGAPTIEQFPQMLGGKRVPLSSDEVSFAECELLVIDSQRSNCFFHFDTMFPTGICSVYTEITEVVGGCDYSGNFFASFDGTDAQSYFLSTCKQVCPKRFELPNLPSAFCYSAVESAFPEGMTPEQYNDVVPGFCDQHKAGASIATINTQVEQNAIAELLDSGRVKIRDTVMLGLTKFPLKENESSDWKWVDGSPVTFTHWSDEWEAEGNKQQAVMFKALGWKWAPWNTNVPHMLCQYEMCAWREQKSPMECYPDYYY